MENELFDVRQVTPTDILHAIREMDDEGCWDLEKRGLEWRKELSKRLSIVAGGRCGKEIDSMKERFEQVVSRKLDELRRFERTLAEREKALLKHEAVVESLSQVSGTIEGARLLVAREACERIIDVHATDQGIRSVGLILSAAMGMKSVGGVITNDNVHGSVTVREISPMGKNEQGGQG